MLTTRKPRTPEKLYIVNFCHFPIGRPSDKNIQPSVQLVFVETLKNSEKATRPFRT